MNDSIYWDESSRGYHGNQGHTPYTRGRWWLICRSAWVCVAKSS